MTAPWTIRQATDADLEAVAKWLQDEDARGVQGCFWCNINVIEGCHRDGQMTVLTDPESDQPLAFLCGGPTDPEPPIMEVHSDHRGRGLGRALWEHHLARVRDAGLPGLKVHCQPSTSIPFWKAMGFQEFPDVATYRRRADHRDGLSRRRRKPILSRRRWLSLFPNCLPPR